MRKHVTNKEYETALHNSDNNSILMKISNQYYKNLSEDVLTDCRLYALWRCLSYYDASKGTKFTTNLWKFMHFECKKALQQKYRLNRIPTISINDNIDIPYENINLESIQEYLSILPPSYKKIIFEYYMEARTMEEIGKINNTTREAARQKLNRAIKLLRKMCNK